ncbi:MAG TPA: Rid family hydrolase [Mycobacteriales bacterium]|jgi:2-iminobutanoate/2-iminopropanoate deaminase|nr:Rid family hydrolase [Mycobacteriales bacterium]
MAKREVRTGSAPAPGGAYSQGIIANGFLYTAGVGPIDAGSGEVVGSTIEEQTEKVMANLAEILKAAGLDFSDVVKSTVHLQDSPRDFPGFNTTYQAHFEQPYPVRTTVGSQLAKILVEIDFVAALRG